VRFSLTQALNGEAAPLLLPWQSPAHLANTYMILVEIEYVRIEQRGENVFARQQAIRSKQPIRRREQEQMNKHIAYSTTDRSRPLYRDVQSLVMRIADNLGGGAELTDGHCRTARCRSLPCPRIGASARTAAISARIQRTRSMWGVSPL